MPTRSRRCAIRQCRAPPARRRDEDRVQDALPYRDLCRQSQLRVVLWHNRNRVRTDRSGAPTKDELIRCTDTEALPESRFRCGQRATKALSHADCFFGALILKPPPPCFAWFPSPASRGRKNDSFRKDSRRFIFLPCITNPSPSKPTFW